MNKIKLVPMTKVDKELLTTILVKSFDSDTQYYYGEKAKGGPPGYDNGELSIKIIGSEEFDSFLIKNFDSFVGCISINIYQREISYFCLLPEYQSKGLGTIVWEEIENIYGTNDWSVETPAYSLKNHAFYKKLGFKKIYEKTYPSEAISYVFEKNDISKLSRKKIKELVYREEEFIKLLEIVEKIGIVDAWIVAGTFRNYLWNALMGRFNLDLSTDIDVAFYDKALEYEENQRIEYRLKQDYPMYKWEVKNQVYMNKHNPNTLPYINTRDAVYHYPEKCTALAIRMVSGKIEIFSPYGFDDIERFEITPTPYIVMDSLRIEMYNKRQKSKSWQNKYPKLKVKYLN